MPRDDWLLPAQKASRGTVSGALKELDPSRSLGPPAQTRGGGRQSPRTLSQRRR